MGVRMPGHPATAAFLARLGVCEPQMTLSMRAQVTAVSLFLLTACSAYAPPDSGLIANPTFAPDSGTDRVGEPWSSTQHGGDRSYRTTVSAGVLRIERIGPEPWGQTVQIVPAEDLRGRRAEFSVELAGDLEPVEGSVDLGPRRKGYSRTGIGVVVKGFRDDPKLRRLGTIMLEKIEHEPRLSPGEHDWERHRLTFDVPETATNIEVQIRLTRHGVLKARGPRLVAVGE